MQIESAKENESDGEIAPRRRIARMMTHTPANYLNELHSSEDDSYPHSDTSETEDSSLISTIFPRELNGFELLDKKKPSTLLQEFTLLFSRLALSVSVLCKYIISWRFFEVFVITVILINVGTIIAEDPNADEQSETLQTFEVVFLYLYTAEALLKIGGLGFVMRDGSYLRDPWNKLDFIILVTGWVEYLLQEGVNLSVLRTLRLIRPLKSISSIKGLKVLSLALISSFKSMLLFLIVLVFFLLLFAVGGLQMWMGLLHYQCMDVDTGYIRDGFVCGNVGCPLHEECAYVLDNPNYGMTNFDNFLYSFLVVFQCITAEGWFDVMISLRRTFTAFVFFYFVPLIVIGAFLVINLILAVIKYAFRKAMNKVEREEPAEEIVVIDTAPNLCDERDEEFRRVHRATGQIDETVLELSISHFQEFSPLNPEKNPKTKIKSNKIKVSLVKQIVKSNMPCSINPKLLQEVLKKKNLSKIKVVVRDDVKVTSSSTKDVLEAAPIPKQTVHKIIQHFFLYAREEPEYSTLTSLMRKFRGNSFKAFLYLSNKTNNKSAYRVLMPLAYDTVTDCKKTDKDLSCVRGIWSGYEVFSEFNHDTWMHDLSHMSYTFWSNSWEKTVYPILCLVESSYFNIFMNILVILNTIVLAYHHYGISAEMEEALEITNYAFTLVFLLEMFLKLISLGLVGYLRDPLNYLDCSVVIVSVIEFIFLSQSSGVTAFRTIRVFRLFRVLRVARLFRYMRSMLNIIRAITQSLDRIVYLALLLLLLIIIFALLGMQIFGGKFDFPEGTPRANFDSFLWAFVTVFQVLSTENWQEVAANAMRSEAGPFSVIFFIIWIFIGNFILLNLLLAILIDSFDETNKDKEQSEIDENTMLERRNTSIFGNRLLKKRKRMEKQRLLKLKTMSDKDNPDPFFVDYESLPNSKSFFIFPKENPFRILCHKISSSSRFDSIVLGVIFLSSLKLIADTYIMNEPSDSTFQRGSLYLDIVFTIAFSLEFAVKAISLGFVFSPKSYLRDEWNVLDFFIVVISIIELSVSGVNVSAFKVLRLLRTLRPLRFITQNLTMKIMVIALLESLIALVNVVIVLLVVWLMFAILGVSFFGGKLYSCEKVSIKDRETCEAFGFKWQNADAHFDNVPQAMLTLFVVSSLEGWPSIMLSAVDSTGEDQGPERNATEWAAIYFIVFIFIGSFFFLNLFIGVIFQTFSEAKRNESSMAAFFLPSDHLVWVEIQDLITKSRPVIIYAQTQTGGIRGFCYRISKSKVFEYFILVCIILNTVQMAMIYEGAPQDYVKSLDIANLVFSGIFIFEAVIKISGLGKAYFYQEWNRFDFFVVVVSIVDIVIEYALNSSISIVRYGPQLLRVARVLRVSRLVRIFKVLKGVQQLVTVLRYSLAAILNVLSLLVLIFFIYAVLGVFLLHEMKRGKAINEFTNFDNFGSAMLALFRIATGEDWNLIMYDAVDQLGPWCVVYFVSFVVISSFIMLNLFVMVLLQNFDDLKTNPQSALKQFNKDRKQFNLAWNPFSISSQGKCTHYKNLVPIMYKLGDGLGVESNRDEEYVLRRLSMMGIYVENDGYVYYHDFLYSVLRRKYTSRMNNPKKNPYWKKVLRIEEKKNIDAIDKLREIAKESLQVSSTQGNSNVLFSMMLVRILFKTWKQHVALKGRKSSMVTPMFSELEFPGFNSYVNSVDSY